MQSKWINPKVKGGLSEDISRASHAVAQGRCSLRGCALVVGGGLDAHMSSASWCSVSSFLMWMSKGNRVEDINANMVSLTVERNDVWRVIYSRMWLPQPWSCSGIQPLINGPTAVLLRSVILLRSLQLLNALQVCCSLIIKSCWAENLFYQHANALVTVYGCMKDLQ